MSAPLVSAAGSGANLTSQSQERDGRHAIVEAGDTLRFELPEAAQVRLEIFDAQGRRVWERAGHFPAGRHQVEWDLRTRQGGSAAPSIYTIRLVTRARTLTGKLVVLP